MPDIELWNAFTAGDKEAFSDLFRRFYPLLFQYGIKIANEEQVVEDAIQELFLELWHKPPQQSITSVKAYLLTAVKFKLYKAFREQKRFPVVADAGPDSFYLFAEGAAGGRDEEAGVIAKVVAAVDKLPARQKEVIYLKLYKGLTYEEVSEVMALNYQVVRNLLCTAIKSLKKLYASPVVAAVILLCVQR